MMRSRRRRAVMQLQAMQMLRGAWVRKAPYTDDEIEYVAHVWQLPQLGITLDDADGTYSIKAHGLDESVYSIAAAAKLILGYGGLQADDETVKLITNELTKLRSSAAG